ncbi:MAG: phytanoyl-CoA dioxygenase family protein [Candidatus Poribacteria bacterium]|nr:phytanoyl-CoA dioxygenase family protein [Candidatus Poribacteria bacterium]
MIQHITEEQWKHFYDEGYVRIGKVMTDDELDALQRKIDDIMLGTAPVDYDRMLMQLDREPGKNSPGPQSKGHKGATLLYRKIQDLEFDPLFLSYMQNPIFREVCAKIYGEDRPIACFRAMFMNKPAREGTRLVWHQDRWTDLDRDALITIYTALDPATVENGCVKVIPGSHRTLVNPTHGSGFLTPEQAEEIAARSAPVYLELEAGEVVLLHNWLLHSSDVNHTDIPRRAFSVCCMDAATKSSHGNTFSRIFGEGALSRDQLQQCGG